MADLALICPTCQASVNVPIEADVETFDCTECDAKIPLDESIDQMTGPLVDPLIGQVVSECEIERKVGEGGFGAVYRAFDRKLERPVALKVMLQSLTSNLEFVRKFIREAIRGSKLGVDFRVGAYICKTIPTVGVYGSYSVIPATRIASAPTASAMASAWAGDSTCVLPSPASAATTRLTGITVTPST